MTTEPALTDQELLAAYRAAQLGRRGMTFSDAVADPAIRRALEAQARAMRELRTRAGGANTETTTATAPLPRWIQQGNTHADDRTD